MTELLWESGLAGNLRTALHGLRTLPGAREWLESGEKLVLHARTDLAAFEAELLNGRYAEALARWNNAGTAGTNGRAFMQGFLLTAARPFNDWLEVERRRVQALYLDCLQRRGAELAAEQQFADALVLFRSLLAEDPLNEWAHREVMRLEWLRNSPDMALRQFESCRRALMEELGLEPSTATVTLHDEILAGLASNPQLRPTQGTSSLPEQLFGSLIGRGKERRELSALLVRNRLVTVVGLGGVGKTRLARHLAENLADRYEEGAVFVPLAALSDPDFLAPTIAGSLGLRLAVSSLETPVVQLLNHLRDKQMLLVLDNFEHLLSAAGLLDDMLAHCAGITILATSREVLELPQEEQYRLNGLPFPSEQADDKTSRYDAVKLFVASAGQISRSFRLTSQNRTHVATICRLVEGLPLGLELAAAWVDAMPLAEIAAELEASLERLSGTRAETGLMTEHRGSMRATLDASWRLLSTEEQLTLAKLSLFHGGFERFDAEQVSGATLRTLLGLVKKSLLRRRSSGRFELHELVRQFAHTKLADEAGLRAAHGRHYLRLLRELSHFLDGTSQEQTTRAIESELANVRAAWQWAAIVGDRAALAGAAEVLFRFYDIRALNVEAHRAFTIAVQALAGRPEQSDRDYLLPKLLSRQAFFANRLAHYDEAHDLLASALRQLAGSTQTGEMAFAYAVLGAVDYQQGNFGVAHSSYTASLELYRGANDRRGTGIALDGLGTTAFAQGRYSAAEEHYERSLGIAEELADPWGTVRGLKNLGVIKAVTGAYVEARALLLRAVETCRQTNDQRALASSLNNLGRVEQLLGYLEASALRLEECSSIRARSGDPWGWALAVSNLGAVRGDQGNEAEAKRLFQDALTAFERIGNRSGSLLSHNRLGGIALGEDDEPGAYHHFRTALELAQLTGEWAGANTAVVGLASLLIVACPGKAVELLTVVQAQSSSERSSVATSERLLLELSGSMPAEAFSLSQQRTANLSLEKAAAELLTDVSDTTLDDFKRWAAGAAKARRLPGRRR